MSDPKCARMMLDSAVKDLRSMRLLEDEGPEESFGFHFQQAAEKALKAWIALLGGLYELTHSLETLLEQLENHGADAADVARYRDLAGYTPYAVEFRYQGIDEDTEPIDRAGAIALATELLDHVRAELATVEQKRSEDG